VEGENVSLGDTTWTVVELEGGPVPQEAPPTLVLDLEEARVAGFAGVNRLVGPFSLDEEGLRFGALATTRMAGPEDAMATERRLLDALAHVTSYRLEGRSLELLAEDRAVVRLAC